MPDQYQHRFRIHIPPEWLAEFARLIADGPGIPYLTVHERIDAVSWDQEIEKLIAILCKRAARLRENGG